ncbi:hypothetical protein DMA15_00980 [Streptomyces sp. WAC 01529]|nr:hypothetical protein DMA15_00980 [Streptomyces sp. WAC 01529]
MRRRRLRKRRRRGRHRRSRRSFRVGAGPGGRGPRAGCLSRCWRSSAPRSAVCSCTTWSPCTRPVALPRGGGPG